MAINKKLITFDKKSTFLGANGINNASSPDANGCYGLIPSTSIVFILDTGELWTHGKYINNQNLTQIKFPYESIDGKIGVVSYNPTSGWIALKYYLWGNEFSGKDPNIEGELQVATGTTNKYWVYGNGAIKYKATQSLSVLEYTSDGKVTVPYNNFTVSTGKITVSTGGIETLSNINGSITAAAYLKGLYLKDTAAYYSTSFMTGGLGKMWNSIKQFDASGNAVDLVGTRPALLTIQGVQSKNDWQPWITAATTDKASWGIGLGDTSFYIGRVANDENTNKLTTEWKFESDGSLVATKYKVPNGKSTGFLKADGSIDETTYATVQGSIEVFTKATMSANGTSGLVPAPSKDDYSNREYTYLRADATWHTLGTIVSKNIGDYYSKEEIDAIKVTLNPGSINLLTSWTDAYDLKDLANGSYLLIADYRGFIYTGVFSFSSSSTCHDEIALHKSGNSTVQGVGQFFARLNNTKLQFSVEVKDEGCEDFKYKIKQLTTI